MTAEYTEPLDSIITVLGDWNRANSDNIKPVIIDIANHGPERGKRLDLGRSDYVLCYETAHSEEQPDLFYNFVKLFRHTFQVEVVILAELIP